MTKSFHASLFESTCQKRRVCCELLDAHGHILARESNRCNPPDWKCLRLNEVTTKDNYPSSTSCNSTHAEIVALGTLLPSDTPKIARIYGHTFVCPDCEEKLRQAGVETIETYGF